MKAGKLRHRIVFEQPVENPGPFNEARFNWTTYREVWAEVRPMSGREYFASQQAQSDVSHEITTRYLAGVTPRMRVRFGSRIFDIRAVMNVEERNIQLRILAVEHGVQNSGVSQ